MGVKASEDLPKNPEKSVTAKADVVRWLKASFDAALENYPKIDKQKAVKFLGHDATCEEVLLRALGFLLGHCYAVSARRTRLRRIAVPSVPRPTASAGSSERLAAPLPSTYGTFRPPGLPRCRDCDGRRSLPADCWSARHAERKSAAPHPRAAPFETHPAPQRPA